MRGWGTSAKFVFFGSFLALSCQVAVSPADASPNRQPRQLPQTAYEKYAAAKYHGRTMLHGQYARAGLSCVPFARSEFRHRRCRQRLAMVGQRGGYLCSRQRSRVGSVLTFRSNGRMRLGHVAVVSRVINPREIEIEHANWWGPGMHGGIARNIPVVDVSEANDWSAVARRTWARRLISAAFIRPTASSTTGPTPA